MGGARRWKQFSATGDIAAPVATADVNLGGCVLTPAAADATAVLRSGGSGGTVVLTLIAKANTNSVVVPQGMQIQAPHLTLTGAGALFSILV